MQIYVKKQQENMKKNMKINEIEKNGMKVKKSSI